MAHFQVIGRAFRRFGRAGVVSPLVTLLALFTVSCKTPQPKEILRVTDIETYWVLDPSRTEKLYLAPAVRFRVENLSPDTLISVDATAAFLREGVDDPWGSGFFRLTEGSKRMEPGKKVLVTMSSDARYALEGTAASVFTHKDFKPVTTKFFLRVGSSVWEEFGRLPVENVIGSRDARQVLSQPQ